MDYQYGKNIAFAYLEAHTKEKIYILASPEFCTLKDHCLIVDRELYGLCTSGQSCHERFAECMKKKDSNHAFAKTDIWMQQNGSNYE